MALKPEYGPTLRDLLAPRWRRASARSRGLALGAGVIVLAGIVLAVIALRSARAGHGGAVPFSFAYKGLGKADPEAGGYVRVQRLSHGEYVSSAPSVSSGRIDARPP